MSRDFYEIYCSEFQSVKFSENKTDFVSVVSRGIMMSHDVVSTSLKIAT